jgi:hypothetical protein
MTLNIQSLSYSNCREITCGFKSLYVHVNREHPARQVAPATGYSSRIRSNIHLGKHWPVITPDRWLSDFAKLEIREEIRPKVLKANARRLLGI